MGATGSTEVRPGAPTAAGVPGLAAAAALLVGFAAVFLIVCLPDLRAPFGHSDEGINAAVWGYGSRSFREMGPADSVLGGRRLDGNAYATHPPGLLTETAVIETIAGEHRWATRAPAWLGSLAAIPLGYLLARALGLARVAAAAVVVAAFGTPMFFTYGWMLDTPVTSFPFGLGLAVVWQRERAGPPRPWPAAALALACGLSGWQATWFAVVLGGWLLLAPDPDRGRRASWPYLGGAAMGAALSLGWGWWVYGDLGQLRDKLLLRSAGEASGLPDVLAYQGRWTVLLLGLGVIGLVACVVALRDAELRPLAACSLAAVGVYMLVFRGAAGSHPFWNYWVLLPALVGYAYVARRITADLGDRADRVLVTGAIALAAVGIVLPGTAKLTIRAGVDAIDALAVTPPTDSQTSLRYLGDLAKPEDWMLYELGLVGVPVDGVDELTSWAVDHPDEVVLVVAPCPPDDEVCAALWPVGTAVGDYSVVSGAQVADVLGD